MASRPAIALIGMPGAGKSTLGRWLAAHLGLPLVDTDQQITDAAGQTLQDILRAEGSDGLAQREAAVLCALSPVPAVIATGGSVVYSAAGMDHLSSCARIVYLDCDPATAAARMGDHGERGLLKRPEQSIADLHAEREGLYRRYADITVDCRARTVDAVGRELCTRLALPLP